MHEPVDRPQRRRLAGAVRPDQRHDLALAHLDRDPLERVDGAVERVHALDGEDHAVSRYGRRLGAHPVTAALPRYASITPLVLLDLLRQAFGDLLAVVEHGHAVGDPHHQLAGSLFDLAFLPAHPRETGCCARIRGLRRRCGLVPAAVVAPPPHPAATSASVATSRARNATSPRFLTPPPRLSPLRSSARCSPQDGGRTCRPFDGRPLEGRILAPDRGLCRILYTVQWNAGTMLGCRAEVAELGDALDSKSSGALPRAGSIPAFGIHSPAVRASLA